MGFGIIYRATNLINGKCYVGQTIFTIDIRKCKHLKNANNGYKNKFSNALRKYLNKSNWKWEILKDNVPVIDLISEKKTLLSQAEKDLESILKKYSDEIILLDEKNILTFDYPVLEYPVKINSLSFDKLKNLDLF